MGPNGKLRLKDLKSIPGGGKASVILFSSSLSLSDSIFLSDF